MNSVMNIGDNIIFLNEGILEWQGSRDRIMDAKNEKLNEFVFASELFKKIKVADSIISESNASEQQDG
jgi:phospholipid/cholesterol/gamma-HCH transport system ATP-binding protein